MKKFSKFVVAMAAGTVGLVTALDGLKGTTTEFCVGVIAIVIALEIAWTISD